ncbi:MAG: UDP-glucose 4-epimerase GalE [Desulfobacterales bacterium]|nr:UDP-glucose 4-epimerase GalE [Desulfobacterales bacterium]
MNILVVGGAGYIGSHMCKYLSKHNFKPIVLDNLCCGHKESVKWGPFIEGSIEDSTLVDNIFSNYKISAVMHFAAFCYVGESVTEPLKYYQNNVSATINLLESMMKHNILNFIFSSSCATYGEPKKLPIEETEEQNPINPYGKTKLMVEHILKDFEKAYGMKHFCLRYFNAAGADPDGMLGEDHRPETHLIPIAIQAALGRRELVNIYGNNYETKDGTCVRDYIHVEDLAQAHLLALKKILEGEPSGHYNLGNGDGFSVKEIIDIVSKTSGKKIKTIISEKRPGDPAVLVGSNKKAISDLGWNPQYTDIKKIIETAWKWHQANPNGYSK